MAAREERQQPPHRRNDNSNDNGIDNRDDVHSDVRSAVPNDSCRFACTACGRSFKRLEHLGRHRQSHQAVKRFACPVCLKRFARSDILLRHTLLHRPAAGPTDPHPAASSGRPPAAPGRPRKERRRACQACAKAHESCSKGAPCQRCLVRSVQCVYSTSTEDGGTQHGQDASSAAEPVPPTTATTASFFSGTTATVDQAPASFVDVPFQDSTAEAVTLLLDMQTDMQTSMPTGMQPEMQAGMQPASDQLMPAYNNWAAQGLGLPPDGPTLNFSINWLPENLHSDLDYVSILGPSLNLMSSDLVTSQLEHPSSSFPFQQMHLPVDHGPLQADLTLNNAMPHLLHNNSGDRLGSSASTSPVTSPVTASGHTPPGANRTTRHLYTNGANGARAPCTVRDTRDYVPIPGTKPLPAISAGLGGGVSDATSNRRRSITRLPSLSHISVAHVLPAGANANMHVWPSTYEHLRQGIRQASRAGARESAFDDGTIPTLEQINYFVYLYFEKCNPVLPILHDHFCALNESWLLALAIATVGAQYTFTEEFTDCASALHEVLQQALQMELDDDSGHGICSLATVQALLLSQVGLLYHGPSRPVRRTRVNHSILVDMLRCHQLLEPSTPQRTSSASVDRQWRQWVHDESRRRLGYSIWLLDCMMVFHMGHRALLTLSDAHAPLPHDGLWAAPTADTWSATMKQTHTNPSLPSATQQLFVDKLIKPDIGEFSRILLLHGVYQEIWLVKRYCDRPLVNWEAVPDRVVDRAVDRADPHPAVSASPSTSVASPPPIDTVSGEGDTPATYSNWRNAACDCIDALHWAANGTIAQLAGREHTTVFHLHFSRVVLLTPYDAIQTLARYLASVAAPNQSGSGVPNAGSPSRAQGLAAERRVLAWAQQDEHKARLAVLHCGCLFWHVRRYSTNAWYEPVAVYMAALAIWAYSSYARQTARSARSRGEEPDGRAATPDGDDLPDVTDDQFPSFIHLDRPNDDEMVMLFVRSGRPSVMRAYISGIGDIGAPPAPVRILQEGAKILAKVSMAWGRTDRYIHVLTGMRAALTKASE